jgi:hypothetical protein
MNKALWHAFLVSAAFLGFGLQAVAQTTYSTEELKATQRPPALTFPREIVAEGGTIVLHVPQIDAWKDFEKVTGRFAVEVTPDGEAEAVIGTAEFVADTEANLEERVVAIDNTQIIVTSFPVADENRRAQLDRLVRSVVQQRTQYVPLDVMLSYIANDASLPAEEGLSFDPPPIFYSSTPGVLVMTDGEAVLAPITGTKIKYAVNTNWDLFQYKDREWYLRHGKRWLKSKQLDGTWKFDNSLPGDFKKLPDDGNWLEVKAAIPPAKGDKTPPVVFYSDKPAELIVTDGQPSFSTISSGGLEYVHDTESDLFRYDRLFYYLVSGRWFSAAVLKGPWQHVTQLPAEFANIPADGPKGHVLAAVAGTEEARLAVLEASIPRKATVSRDAGQDIIVFYQGDPEFGPIAETGVQRALNSPNDVLLYEGVYYLCDNAVWYQSDSAEGPWVVADMIPAAIYDIPPSSAAYHVTHVHVYDSDEDSVSTGYTSGYFGVHVGFGIAMYGSGWYYPPYYGYYPYYGYPYYPYYYPYPYSYGASAWYNPKTGMYGRSGSVYGPYGGYGRAASYNPATGTYARGAAVWDSNEIAGTGFAYNPRTGTGVATHRYATENGGWGESLVTQNDRWLQTRSEWTDDSRYTEYATSGGKSGEIVSREVGDSVIRAGRTSDGDLYAGKDGQVYKRGDDGWYQHGDEGWNRVEVSDERAAQIDQARSHATERFSTLEALDPSQVAERRQSVSDAWSGRTYDSSRNFGSFDSSKRQELNRSFNARTNGYQRYDQRSRSSTRMNQQRPSSGQFQRRRR